MRSPEFPLVRLESRLVQRLVRRASFGARPLRLRTATFWRRPRLLESRFEVPAIGAVDRGLEWEVDSEIALACEEVREPFQLRRDVVRLEELGASSDGDAGEPSLARLRL